MKFLDIIAPQGRIPCAILTKFSGIMGDSILVSFLIWSISLSDSDDISTSGRQSCIILLISQRQPTVNYRLCRRRLFLAAVPAGSACDSDGKTHGGTCW